KIDQSFVADMLVQPDSAAIVKSVLSLASDMKIGVVAEGIETAEQLAYFKGTACEAAQGYFIGKPMRAAQASALLGVVTKSSSQAA
ncbi:MAG: GGDEF-domain containing protein, partial [Tardiphaga sp.]|nr:GGDEF-domain containing protein [Tardiphaga sp.]